MPFLHLSESLFDGTVAVGHRLDRVVLVSNPNDLAVRQDAARAFATTVFAGSADYFGEARIDGQLGWMHDFVDPWSPGAGSTEQVVAILSAGLGIGEPTAGGVLVPPLVAEGQRGVQRPFGLLPLGRGSLDLGPFGFRYFAGPSRSRSHSRSRGAAGVRSISLPEIRVVRRASRVSWGRDAGSSTSE